MEKSSFPALSEYTKDNAPYSYWALEYYRYLHSLMELATVREKTILDFGCGIGFFTKFLDNGSNEIHALDGMDRTRDLPQNDRVHFQTFYFKNELPFHTDFFDLILCNQVLEHIEKPDTLLLEFLRVLKPGGRVLIDLPNTPWNIITFILGAPTSLLKRLIKNKSFYGTASGSIRGSTLRRKNRLWKILAVFIGYFAHAAYAFEEHVNFRSAKKWIALFEKSGFILQKCKAIHLFPFISLLPEGCIDRLFQMENKLAGKKLFRNLGFYTFFLVEKKTI